MLLHVLLVRLASARTRSQDQGLSAHREDTCLLEAPRHGHHLPHGHGGPAPCGGGDTLRPPCLIAATLRVTPERVRRWSPRSLDPPCDRSRHRQPPESHQWRRRSPSSSSPGLQSRRCERPR